ncbi:MAG: hypothetical protein P8010_04405 [Desulfosarcinaceae bacterium]|jgi:hypothetical protein
MKIEEVPQDQGMMSDERREVCYAVDDQGRYTLVPSHGWEPKNVANDQAWEQVRMRVRAVIALIRAGKRSPLAYHMAHHQMSPGLLARYVRLSRLRVWQHLRPRGYNRLTPALRRRYAEIFAIEPDALDRVPEAPADSRASVDGEKQSG